MEYRNSARSLTRRTDKHRIGYSDLLGKQYSLATVSQTRVGLRQSVRLTRHVCAREREGTRERAREVSLAGTRDAFPRNLHEVLKRGGWVCAVERSSCLPTPTVEDQRSSSLPRHPLPRPSVCLSFPGAPPSSSSENGNRLIDIVVGVVYAAAAAQVGETLRPAKERGRRRMPRRSIPFVGGSGPSARANKPPGSWQDGAFPRLGPPKEPSGAKHRGVLLRAGPGDREPRPRR